MGIKTILIVGPTAVGKTELSLKIAKKFNGEIISGDSMQVYKNLNIGTAKVTKEEQEQVRHHLIDICGINERWSVAQFAKKSKNLINEITNNKKLPIIVGGTGFYLQALVDNYNLGNDKYQNNEIREKWHQYARQNGKQALWEKLKSVDYKAAQKIPFENERRVVRALEVYQKTKTLFSSQKDSPDKNYEWLIIGLNTNREILYDRINRRVDLMMQQGLLREAKYLYDNGGANYQSGQAIGYKEFFEYFLGKKTLKEAITDVKKDSRHFAKRQLTWFRNKMNVQWFDIISSEKQKYKIDEVIMNWLEK